jgi:replicative DNA helicase
MMTFAPGQLLAIDETTKPRVNWTAYGQDGQTWAACYIDGGLLTHGRINGRVDWYHNRQTKTGLTKVAVTEGTIGRARACRPDEPPVLPAQAELADVLRGWDTPTPLSREATLPTFPVDVFPEWIATFIEALAVATQTPVDMAAMMALADLSTAAGGLFTVKIDNNWLEPVNLYLATALPPGERKTAVVNTVTAPVHDVDREEAEHARSEITATKARKAIADEVAKAAATAAIKADEDHKADLADDAIRAAGSRADRGAGRTRLLADDATPEALASLMADQRGRMAILSDEGGIFDLIAGRYNNGRGNLELYLKAWSGSPYRVDRKGRPAECIQRPALTVGLTVQPDVLRSIAAIPGFRGRGVIGRHLFSLPASMLGRRDANPAQVRTADTEDFRSQMAVLVRTVISRKDPTELVPDIEAKATIRAFLARIEPRLGPGGDLAPISDWAAKLAGQLVRVAALLHIAADYRYIDRTISERTMAGAVGLADYFIAHAQAVFDVMSASPVVDNATYVLGWLAGHDRDTFNARDLYTANRYRFPTADDLAPVLEHLEAFGWIRLQPSRPEPPGRGRPRNPTWEINPTNRQQNQQ